MAHDDPDQIVRDVARRISEIRLGLDLTQEATAERLGMSLKGYQRIERGLQNLTLKRPSRGSRRRSTCGPWISAQRV